VEEMEWWWSRQRGCWRAWASVFTAGELVKRIQRAGDLVFDNGNAVGTQTLPVPGLYVPLARSLFERRLDPRRLLEPSGLRGLLRNHLDEDNRGLLRARLRQRTPPRFLVLGIPRPSGDRALIALHFGDTEVPLLDNHAMTPDAKIEPVLINRLDHKRLMERGGANPDLAQKRVVVVGVGAVGGYVAEAIARTGIGELLLIDPDLLQPENMYRHTLGCPRLSQISPILALVDGPMPVPKAETLASHIRSSLLHLKVGAITASIQTALEQALGAADLMIVAIGNPTVSRGLNLELLSRGAPRAIYTWLEPLGVGGHALLTAAVGQPGCYECLFADDEGTELLAPRTDFVAPDQDVLSRLGGCGMSFTPFSDLDARRTAELAVRLAVEALTDSELGPRLRSWRGSSAAAKARGVGLTARYDLSQDELDAELTCFVHRECRICG
jgi:molybdopterin/thiamine biosynthesis adenylyltransferase